jgi:hypothetical protein
MTKYILAVYTALFERPVHDLVGAAVISLIVALALAGLYRLVRKKAPETLVLSSTFLFVASVVSMVLTLGFTMPTAGPVAKPVPDSVAGSGSGSGSGSATQRSTRPRGPGNLDNYAANALLIAADLDNDGTLSPEEATQFILSADADGKGSVNVQDLSQLFSRRRGSRGGGLGGNTPSATTLVP